MIVKCIIFLFILLFHLEFITAQKNSKQDFDQDSLLLKELVDQSKMMVYKNFDSCLLLSQKILELCTANLETELEHKERQFFLSKKGIAYKFIGISLGRKGDLDGSLTNYKKLLKLRKEENKPLFIAMAHNDIGVVYSQKGEMDSALLYYYKGLEINRALDNKKGILAGLGNTSILLTNKGKYIEALGNLQQTLSLSKEMNDSLSTVNALFCIAEIYALQEDAAKARRYYEESLHYCEAIDDEEGKGIALDGIGSTYFMEGEYELAKKFLKKSLKTSNRIGDLFGEIEGSLDLGEIARKENDNELALEYYNKVLDFSKQAGAIEFEGIALSAIGAIAFEQNQLDNALMNGEKGFVIAKKTGDLKLLNQVAKLLADVYTQKGKYKEGIEMLELYVSTKDSLVNDNQSKKIIQLTEAYKYEVKGAQDSIVNAKLQQEKDVELALQKIENEQQKQQNIFLFFGLLLMIIFGGFIYRRYQVTNRQKKIIQEQKKQVDSTLEEIKKSNAEKELLLKEIHHRVKNNLQIISSLLDLQSSKIDNDVVRSAMEDGQFRVKSMALIHNKLYQHENIATVNFKEYVGQLFEQIMGTLTVIQPILVLKVDEATVFDIDTAIPLGLILNELLTNACKYAFEEGKEGQLIIKLIEKEKGNYLLEVKDNGNGMPADFKLEKARSLGLRLVRRLSKQLLGKATYRNDNGASFCIEFKNTILRKTID